MLKRKESNKDIKSQLMIIGSLLILISFIILSIKLFSFIKDKNIENQKLNNFYNEQENIKELIKAEEITEADYSSYSVDYIAVLKIEKIGLEKGLVSKNDSNNNVDKNIQILEESDYPDVENGNVMLASHNGNGSTSYFKDIHKLESNDEVIIYYGGYQYQYKVINSYEVEKTGKINIVRNGEKSTLTLITCKGNDKQLVIICELVNKK